MMFYSYIYRALDFLNLMAYDLYTHHGAVKTGHHSGLYSVNGDSLDDSRRVVVGTLIVSIDVQKMCLSIIENI